MPPMRLLIGIFENPAKRAEAPPPAPFINRLSTLEPEVFRYRIFAPPRNSHSEPMEHLFDLHISNEATTEELSRLSDSLERWVDECLDDFSCGAFIDPDSLNDLANGEIPSARSLGIGKMLENYRKMAEILRVPPITLSAHEREQLEAELDEGFPRGMIMISIDDCNGEGCVKSAIHSLRSRLPSFCRLEDAGAHEPPPGEFGE